MADCLKILAKHEDSGALPLIVHLENGKYNPSLKLAMDIAKVFHVTVEDLFAFVDDQANP